MKNIHVLPTDKETRLFIADGKLFNYHKHQQGDGVKVINQNIHITSDEEIKEGDWCYHPLLKGGSVIQSKFNNPNSTMKKIILTTDQDLIKDGVWGIEDGFLEWFVKNPGCEYVELKGYAIILPGESCDCDNKCDTCKEEEPKQEILEYDLLQHIKFCLECKNDSQAIRLIEKYGFEKQERMYSEEEVKQLMTLAFEQGFKKADIVEAGLEAKETDTEVNWIFLKHKK